MSIAIRDLSFIVCLKPMLQQLQIESLFHYIHATRFIWNGIFIFNIHNPRTLPLSASTWRLFMFDKPRRAHKKPFKITQELRAKIQHKAFIRVIFNYFMSKHNLLRLWRFGWLWNCSRESENNLCKLAGMLIFLMFYKRKHRSFKMHTMR